MCEHKYEGVLYGILGVKGMLEKESRVVLQELGFKLAKRGEFFFLLPRIFFARLKNTRN